MPIYDEKELDLYSNPNYVLSLMEKDEVKKQDEEEEKEIYPDYSEINKGSYPDFAEITGAAEPAFKSPRKETVSDLRDDEQFQQDGQVVLEYLANNQGALSKIFTASAEQSDSPDIVEFLRDEDNRLPTLFTNADLYKDAPEEVLRSYRNIRQRFDDSGS